MDDDKDINNKTSTYKSMRCRTTDKTWYCSCDDGIKFIKDALHAHKKKYEIKHPYKNGAISQINHDKFEAS